MNMLVFQESNMTKSGWKDDNQPNVGLFVN